MKLSLFRDTEHARVARYLPAPVYNLAQHLLARGGADCVYVPIRSMQYLAVLDAQEFVFVDGERKALIEIAWQHFRPQARTALEEPVAYEAVYYDGKAAETMKRLQGEFDRALRQLAAKSLPDRPASVLHFDPAARRSHG